MTANARVRQTPTSFSLEVGPVRIDYMDPDEAVTALIKGELKGAVHLCNAYTVALADERDDVAASLRSSSTNFPDGTPLVWVARRRGHAASGRVYGPDLMESALDLGRRSGVRHYLYGSTPSVLQALEDMVGKRWPGALIAGSESPTFGEISDSAINNAVDRASRAQADIVWVALGTPKQDLIVHRMAAIGDLTYVAVGAAFDFLSGNKMQAPRWMQRLGLEWLFRLLVEPRRLWRRYFVYNKRFIGVIWRNRRSRNE